jgi:hypothetical protein
VIGARRLDFNTTAFAAGFVDPERLFLLFDRRIVAIQITS